VKKERKKMGALRLFGNFEEAMQKLIEKGQVGKEILEDELEAIRQRGASSGLSRYEKETGKAPSASMTKLAKQKDELGSALLVFKEKKNQNQNEPFFFFFDCQILHWRSFSMPLRPSAILRSSSSG
jgi:hypothetical protein